MRNIKKKKNGAQLLKATEPLRGGSLRFITNFPEIPGTHMIDLEKMKGSVDLGATQWNPAP